MNLSRTASRFLSHRIAQRRRPAEQLPRCAERHPGPFPEVERVDMADDLYVAKLELGVDHVVHVPARLRERIPRFPVRISVVSSARMSLASTRRFFAREHSIVHIAPISAPLVPQTPGR
jgi:hypothetical protein